MMRIPRGASSTMVRFTHIPHQVVREALSFAGGTPPAGRGWECLDVRFLEDGCVLDDDEDNVVGVGLSTHCGSCFASRLLCIMH